MEAKKNSEMNRGINRKITWTVDRLHMDVDCKLGQYPSKL